MALVSPTWQVRDLPDFSAVDRTVERLPEFQWLVFTSVNGVHALIRRLKQTGRDLRLGHLKLATIGPSTAEVLRSYHRKLADPVPGTFRSEDLAAR